MIDPAQPGLKKHRMTTSTVVFMIFCLCAAGAYGIEGLFDILMSGIRWMTAAFGVLTAALLVIARRVEPAESAARPSTCPNDKNGV
jgi:spore maturation protein SpmB